MTTFTGAPAEKKLNSKIPSGEYSVLVRIFCSLSGNWAMEASVARYQQSPIYP